MGFKLTMQHLLVECSQDQLWSVILSFAAQETTWDFVEWGNLSNVAKRAADAVTQQVHKLSFICINCKWQFRGKVNDIILLFSEPYYICKVHSSTQKCSWIMACGRNLEEALKTLSLQQLTQLLCYKIYCAMLQKFQKYHEIRHTVHEHCAVNV